jgi:DNA invertase Pin-like site-specific DNA recombinase
MVTKAAAQKARKGRSEAPGRALKALGYIRVSTEEQGASGAGLEAQRAAIESACRDRGFELVDVYREVASAKSLDRPDLTACLAQLDAGRADALVVAKIDRLSRSLLDFVATMERARKRGWAIVALDLGVDTATASGQLVANVLASFAEFERRLIGERTRTALAVKKAQGVKVGRPRSLSDEVVARIIADHDSGQSLGAIARALNAEGVPTAHGGSQWHPSTIKRVLESEVGADPQVDH